MFLVTSISSAYLSATASTVYNQAGIEAGIVCVSGHNFFSHELAMCHGLEVYNHWLQKTTVIDFTKLISRASVACSYVEKKVSK